MTCVSTRQLCVCALTDKRGNLTLCASACAGNVDWWLHTLFSCSLILSEAMESGRRRRRLLGGEQETDERSEW